MGLAPATRGRWRRRRDQALGVGGCGGSAHAHQLAGAHGLSSSVSPPNRAACRAADRPSQRRPCSGRASRSVPSKRSRSLNFSGPLPQPEQFALAPAGGRRRTGPGSIFDKIPATVNSTSPARQPTRRSGVIQQRRERADSAAADQHTPHQLSCTFSPNAAVLPKRSAQQSSWPVNTAAECRPAGAAGWLLGGELFGSRPGPPAQRSAWTGLPVTTRCQKPPNSAGRRRGNRSTGGADELDVARTQQKVKRRAEAPAEGCIRFTAPPCGPSASRAPNHEATLVVLSISGGFPRASTGSGRPRRGCRQPSGSGFEAARRSSLEPSAARERSASALSARVAMKSTPHATPIS